MNKTRIAALASALMLGVAGIAYAQSGGGGSGGGGAAGGGSGIGGGAAGTGMSSGANTNAGSSADFGRSRATTGSSVGRGLVGGADRGAVVPGNRGIGGAGDRIGGGATADVPAAGGSTTLTQPGVTRGIPGQTGAAAGGSLDAGGMSELQIRDSLRKQGYEGVSGLRQRDGVWEGQVTRGGRSETVRIDPATGRTLAR